MIFFLWKDPSRTGQLSVALWAQPGAGKRYGVGRGRGGPPWRHKCLAAVSLLQKLGGGEEEYAAFPSGGKEPAASSVYLFFFSCLGWDFTWPTLKCFSWQPRCFLKGEGKLRWEVEQKHFLIAFYGWERKKIFAAKKKIFQKIVSSFIKSGD